MPNPSGYSQLEHVRALGVRLFAAPIFPSDEQKTRRANVLNIELYVVAALVFLFLCVALGDRQVPASMLGIIMLIAMTCVALWFTMRFGQVTLASIGLIVLGLIAVTASIVNLGTIRAPITSFYLIVIVGAGLVFDLSGVIITAIASSLLVLGLIVAENAGGLPTANFSVTLTQWVTYTGIFVLTGILSFLGFRSTRQALARAEQEIVERKHTERLLHIQQELSLALASATTFEAMLDRVLTATFEIQGLDSGGVYLVDEQTGALDLIVHKGFSPEFVERSKYFSADAPQTQLVMTGQTIYRPYHQVLASVNEQRVNEPLRATCILPIQHEGHVIAALNLASHTHNEIGENAHRVLVILATQLGSVIVRIRVENALRETQELFSAFIRQSPIYTYIKESTPTTSRVIQASANFSQMIGIDGPAMIGKTMDELFPPDLAAKFTTDDWSVVSTGAAFNLGEELNGRSYETFKFPITLGNKALLAGYSIDITARKKAEQDLRAREETWHALFESTNDAIFLIGLDKHIFRANAQCEKLLGYTVDELLGQPFDKFIKPRQVPEEINRHERLVSGETFPVYECTFRHKHETEIQTEINLSLIRDAQGKPRYIQSVMRDITERKQAEEALRTSRDALTSANTELARSSKIKSEFLANMSHELRTPLNGILGLSQSLLEQFIGPLNEKQIHMVTLIESSGQHLLSLINDILDLSKIEAGAMKLDFAPIDVKFSCETSLLFIKELAYKKKIQVFQKLDADVEQVLANERAVKQMLVNLLTNAVKFTPEGGQVGLEVIGDKENNLVFFTVWDSGIGIAQQDLPLLFQPFVQIDGSLTRGQEGTGLGLALVAQLAEMHGGRVSVKSAIGKGSRFTITLPWPEAMRTYAPVEIETTHEEGMIAQRPPIANEDANTPLILLVEDHETNSTMLTMYLESRGYRITIARNGLEALEMAHAEVPSVILMDLQMPVMGGLQAIRELRANQDPRIANIPIIALTALAMPVDRDRSIAAGANEYMSKPANLKRLVEMIEKLREDFRLR